MVLDVVLNGLPLGLERVHFNLQDEVVVQVRETDDVVKNEAAVANKIEGRQRQQLRRDDRLPVAHEDDEMMHEFY